jgi:PAS domain S-box-containing protein
LAHPDITINRDPETVYGELAHGIKTSVTAYKAKQALRDSEFKFLTIVNNATEWLFWLDPNRNFIYTSPSCEKITGYTPEHFYRNPELVTDIVHPLDKEKLNQHVLETRKDAGSHKAEFRITTKTGETRWILHECSRVIDSNGKWLGWRATNQDVTDLKTIEEDLAKKELKYKTFIENLAEGIWVINPSAHTMFVNHKMAQMLGYTPQEMLGKHVSCFIEESKQERMNKIIAGRNNGVFDNLSYDFEFLCKDGSKKIFSVQSRPILDEASKLVEIIGSFIDVTEHRKAQQTMQQTLKILEKASESVDAGLVVIDKDYNVLWANKTLNARMPLNRKCFQTFNNQNSVCPDCGVKRVFEENVDSAIHEHLLIDSKGKPFWVEIRAYPIRENDGKISAVIELAFPINERKKIEKQILEQQAKLGTVNEKLQVVGSLARHDVANKLTVIRSYSYLLKKQLKDRPDLQKFVDAIELSVEQSNKIFEFSRLYEKIGAEETSEIAVAQSLNQAIALIPNMDVKVVSHLNGLKVLADSMLRQLFYTLIDNSLKHGKTVTRIEVSSIEEPNQTRLIYQDNGMGIPSKDKEKIFEVGYRTGDGSGLGLKLAKRLVETYGWSIKETGVYGKGARFELTIPKQAN